MKQFIIKEENHGITLQNFLRQYYSVRTLRSYIKHDAITVNGHTVSKKYVLRCNDIISCCAIESVYDFPLHILMENKDYIVLYKEYNTHTAHIIGKESPSIENTLRKKYEFYSLCTRLDYQTSGILFVAKNKQAYIRFREEEAKGAIEKYYIALVEGRAPCTLLTKKIDTAKRKKSKVIDEDIYDNTRYTNIIEQHSLYSHGKECSLIICRIYRGVRHQIRAHLSYEGFPIVGDYLYNATMLEMPFFLHNISVSFIGRQFFSPLPDFWSPYIGEEHLSYLCSLFSL